MTSSFTAPDEDTHADGTMPADFPVPDEALDLIDEAAARVAPAPGENDSAAARVRAASVGRFTLCRELAARLCALVRESGPPSVCPMTRRHVLERYRLALAGSGWTSPEEAHWVIQRMALWLDWGGAISGSRRVVS